MREDSALCFEIAREKNTKGPGDMQRGFPTPAPDKNAGFVILLYWRASWHIHRLFKDSENCRLGWGCFQFIVPILGNWSVILSLCFFHFRCICHLVEQHSKPLTASVYNSHFWRMSCTTSIDYISLPLGKTKPNNDNKKTKPRLVNFFCFLSTIGSTVPALHSLLTPQI